MLLVGVVIGLLVVEKGILGPDAPPPARMDVDRSPLALAARLKKQCSFTRVSSVDEALTVALKSPAIFTASRTGSTTTTSGGTSPSPNQWPAGMAQWEHLAGFAARHGTVRVNARHSALSVANGGATRKHVEDGGRRALGRPTNTSLAVVLASWHSTGSKGMLVFEHADVSHGECAAANNRVACSDSGTWLTDAVRSDLGLFLANELTEKSGADALVLSAAPAGAGLPGHSHGPAWLALAAGSKFWAVHPHPRGEEENVNDNYPPLHWLKTLANFDAADGSGRARGSGDTNIGSLDWCVQHPRDIVFLPAFWRHATLNLYVSLFIFWAARLQMLARAAPYHCCCC